MNLKTHRGDTEDAKLEVFFVKIFSVFSSASRRSRAKFSAVNPRFSEFWLWLCLLALSSGRPAQDAV